jgi:hypothetical protein
MKTSGICAQQIIMPRRWTEEWMWSSTLRLGEGKWSATCPGRFNPGERNQRILNGKEVGWDPKPVVAMWSREKYFAFAVYRMTTFRSSNHSPVIILTELSQLLCICNIAAEISYKENVVIFMSIF